MKSIKNITVFCSSRDLDPIYTEPARNLMKLLAQEGYNLVWGGSDQGLMKLIADSVRENGGKLIGISSEYVRQFARKDADEMIFTKNIEERKATLLERGDALIILPGGLGTLDELASVIEKKRHQMHNKPIIILNTNDFYAGLKTQLERMKEDGFLSVDLGQVVKFADTPEDAANLITNN
jgi:hypothetical protein